MSILKSGKARITAIIGLVGILTSVATGSANAGNYGVNLQFGNGAGIYFSGNSNHKQKGHKKYRNRHSYNQGHYNPYYQPRYNPRPHNQYRQQPRRQVCGPRRAVKKAYRLGLNNPQVHRIKERRIVVSGYRYGYRTKMVFKRYSNCQLLKTVNFNW